MKTLKIKLPDALVEEIEQLVVAGLFESFDEVGRLALVEFVRRHHGSMQERFQRADIRWAFNQKGVR